MSGRFEGNEFIEELEGKAPDGSKEIFRNRWTITNKNEVRIVSEIQDAIRKVKQFGLTLAKREK